jgi:Xaa-Pro aminopeptidase
MLAESALEALKARPAAHIGYEASCVPAGIIEELRQVRGTLKLTDVDPVIHRLKRSKDADEMDVIRQSMRAGDAAHAAAMQEIRPGMSELEAFLVVQQAAIRAAGGQAMVYGDFVTGPRAESGGGPPTDRIIEKGDLVLVDFSVVIAGYRGDFANTFCCGAPPTDQQRRLYEACLDAMAEAEALVRAGRDCREIDAAVRDSFASKHLAENFRSHSGHGLGLGHPDPPYLVRDSTDTLVAGDVIAIEPSQMIEGVAGMRYERNYLVTYDGYELLSHHALQIDATG